MSDNNRQSFTDKAGSALKPDSEKGTFEKASDSIKGNMDSLASSAQPNVKNFACLLGDDYSYFISEPEIHSAEDRRQCQRQF
ncbi:hypothetical protein C0992_003692 [Termitomyces sp. T32_za158]|nr:hypothetical protein C0992_003692 [Termitomyces sp. T32_za158]